MPLGLRTCIYKVSDLNQAKVWYSQCFLTKPYFDEPYYVGFNIGGFELGLQTETKAKKEIAENAVTYWGVEDIQAEYARFLSLGASEYEKPNNVGGEIVVSIVKDPWDNLIGLIYNPDFKLS